MKRSRAVRALVAELRPGPVRDSTALIGYVTDDIVCPWPLVDVISANLPILRRDSRPIGQLELAKGVGDSRRTIARLENAEVRTRAST